MIKRWYIKFCRYVLGKKFLPVMDGYLKGYLWTTERSYEYILGNYEDPETMRQLISWCKADAVFYDLGANIGYHALVANQFIKGGEIYAFEPIAENIALFEKHINLNKAKLNYNNINILPFAVADKTGELTFSDNKAEHDGNSYIPSSPVYQNAETKFTVMAYAIDDLVEDGYLPPAIIKIDVEGAELDVLKGAEETLKQYKPNIILATHDVHLPGVKSDCLKFLNELGYYVMAQSRHNMNIEGLEDFIAVHKDKA
jgi:FkbM family methyltransferase